MNKNIFFKLQFSLRKQAITFIKNMIANIKNKIAFIL